MTPEQVLREKLLPIGRAVLYRELRAGKIPHRKIGRKFVLSRTALQRWLETAGESGRPEAASAPEAPSDHLRLTNTPDEVTAPRRASIEPAA